MFSKTTAFFESFTSSYRHSKDVNSSSSSQQNLQVISEKNDDYNGSLKIDDSTHRLIQCLLNKNPANSKLNKKNAKRQSAIIYDEFNKIMINEQQSQESPVTINGINIITPENAENIKLKPNHKNFLSTTSFNGGSTVCIHSQNDVNYTVKGKGIKSSGSVMGISSTGFTTSTKRKRGSLFNIFSFQKPATPSTPPPPPPSTSSASNPLPQPPQASSLPTQSSTQVVDVAVKKSQIFESSNTLPPPPPEFADLKNNLEYNLNNNGHQSRINTSGSLKQQNRSIFNALKRKSVKSTPIPQVPSEAPSPPPLPPRTYKVDIDSIKIEQIDPIDEYLSNKTINQNNTTIKSANTVINDSILSYSSSSSSSNSSSLFYGLNEKSLNIKLNYTNLNKSTNNILDISDTDSTISNLFYFDNYITPKAKQDESFDDYDNNTNNNSININESQNKLFFAQENYVEDESNQLKSLNQFSNYSVNSIKIRQNKSKKKSRSSNKQVNNYRKNMHA